MIALLVLMTSPRTFAETPDGTIPFDCPDIPDAKFQFHFTRELISLAVTTAPFKTVDDLYIQIYDEEPDIYDILAQYYSEKLEAKNWNSIQQDDSVRLYALNEAALQDTSKDNTFSGIFAIIKGDAEVYLLNIVGNVPSQQAGQLLTNLGKLGIDTPELESPPVLDSDEQPASLRATISLSIPNPFGRFGEQSASPPTRFRTADGSPIHEIRIQGNQKIETAEILKTLEADNEDVDKALDMLREEINPKLPKIETPTQDIDKAVETLRKKMNYKLEGVETSIKQENGKQIAVITVKERQQAAGFDGGRPVIKLNRVTGWELGAVLENTFPGARFSDGTYASKLFGYVGYGFGNRRVNYEFGGNTTPFLEYTRPSTATSTGDKSDKWYLGFGVNAKVYRITGITTPILAIADYDSPFSLLYSLFGGTDLHNYYSRRGFEIGFQWEKLPRPEYRSTPTHLVTLKFLIENHESLEKSTDWHLFNWRSTSKARENPAITPGQMRSVMFAYDMNFRTSYLGWHNTFFVEHSNSIFGSGFDFTRYQLHLRYAHPLGKHRIRARAVGSFSTASLPIQRQFTIGGPGVLNGYPIYAFAGDRGYLFNIEYFYPSPEISFLRNMNLFLVFFLDAGQTWNVNDETRTFIPKSDAGIGFQFGESDSFLRFNVAKAFESEQSVQFNILWFYSF